MTLSHVGTQNGSPQTVSPHNAVGPVAGTTAGDLVVYVVAAKYGDSAPASATGWTNFATSIANTGRPTGNDNGNTRISMLYRVWQAGDTAPTFTVAPVNVATNRVTTYRATASGGVAGCEWGAVSRADDTPGENTISFNFGPPTITLKAGDRVRIDQVLNTDGAAQDAVATISQSGATFGTYQPYITDMTTGVGTDLALKSGQWLVVTPGTGDITTSTALNGTFTNTVGTAILTVIREVPHAKTGTDTGSLAIEDSSALSVTGGGGPAPFVGWGVPL